MNIQLWKRKNYKKDKYNLYIRFRVNQNSAIVESLNIWEWINPKNQLEKDHNKDVETACHEIIRRAKDDYENGRISLKKFNKKKILLKEAISKYLNSTNETPILNFINKYDENMFSLDIREINNEKLNEIKNKIEIDINENKTKGTTASKYWNDFKSLLIALNKKNLCKYPKVSGIRHLHKKKKALQFTEKEINKIKSVQTTKNKEIIEAFLVTCSSGINLSIIENLKWENIKKNDKNYHYIEYTDNIKKHVFPLAEESYEILLKRKSNKPYLFDLKKIDKSKAFKNILRITKISSHKKYNDGVHSFLDKLYRKTQNIYLVSAILGYNSIKKTKEKFPYMDENDLLLKELNISSKSIGTKNNYNKIFKKGRLISYI